MSEQTSAHSSKQGVKVLVAGSILQLFLGIIYVWSVFVKPVISYWDWEEKAVKDTSSYMLACFVFGILVCGRLLGKTGTRITTLAGGLLMSAGMLITSLLKDAPHWSIWITYGVVGGFGVGLAYNSILTCAQKWFPTKRGLATGISVSAFGFGTAIFAPLIGKLVEKYDLLIALRILSIAFLITTLALFSFIKLPESTGAAAASSSDQKQYTTGEMLKTPLFYALPFSMMFLTLSYFVLNPSFISLSETKGYAFGTIILMMSGFVNAIGRLAIPTLGEKIGASKAVFIIILATAISSATLAIDNPVVFIVSIAVIVFCYGGSSGIYPVVTGGFFGLQNIGSNYGFVMIGFMISSLFLAPFIRNIDSLNAQFLITAIIAALGVVLSLILVTVENKNKSLKGK